MFDALYNLGAPYYTVLGIRFSDYTLAYARAKAEATGSVVHMIQYDTANPSGFFAESCRPVDAT